MLERDRAILDEGNRLAVTLHRHHDVEPRLAHLPERFLRGRLDDAHHRTRKAQIAGELHESLELLALHRFLGTGEFDEQDRIRFADQGALDDRPECRIGARQIQHRPIDQFDRGGRELHDVPGRLHRAMKRREVDHAENLVRRQRREL